MREQATKLLFSVFFYNTLCISLFLYLSFEQIQKFKGRTIRNIQLYYYTVFRPVRITDWRSACYLLSTSKDHELSLLLTAEDIRLFLQNTFSSCFLVQISPRASPFCYFICAFLVFSIITIPKIQKDVKRKWILNCNNRKLLRN